MVSASKDKLVDSGDFSSILPDSPLSTSPIPGVSFEDFSEGNFNILTPVTPTVKFNVLDNGNNIFSGSDDADRILGAGGDDELFGGKGDDHISGGTGNDTIYGGEGDDRLNGGSGDDVLYGDTGTNELVGGLGNDTIFGGDGTDLIKGGDGDDFLIGGKGDDFLFGGDGNDHLIGGQGNDFLFGGAGNDILKGGPGTNALYGGDGNDTLVFFEQHGDTSLFDGGAGNDRLRVHAESGNLLSTKTDLGAYFDSELSAGPDASGFYFIAGIGKIKDIETIEVLGLSGGVFSYDIA